MFYITWIDMDPMEWHRRGVFPIPPFLIPFFSFSSVHPFCMGLLRKGILSRFDRNRMCEHGGWNDPFIVGGSRKRRRGKVRVTETES